MYLCESAQLIFHGRKYNAEKISNYVEIVKKQLMSYKGIEQAPVAIFLERSPNMLFVMLAMLELRLPFLPLHIETPKDRLEYMLRNASVHFIVTKDLKLNGFTTIELDFENVQRSSECQNEWQSNNSWSEVAYILYTSGTTGYPKAVEVTRQGLNNFIKAIPEEIPLAKKRIASFTNHTFDIFFLETIAALSYGMEVYLADEQERKNPKKIIDMISQNKIQVIQMTPSGMQLLQLCDQSFQMLSSVEIFLIGGERFPEKLLESLQYYTYAKIFNMYGPTETTIWSAVADLTNEIEVHIGKPIRNTIIKLLNEYGEEVEIGEKGEICILGDGLARGYTNDYKQTQSSFVINADNELCYRTGDIGKVNEEGKLICLGRRDNQIKIRGHRIELEEIENVVIEIEGIIDAAACYEKNTEYEKIIVFFTASTLINKESVLKNLRNRIMDYMIPQIIIQVDNLIYNSNGKKDRKALLGLYKKKSIYELECSNVKLDLVSVVMDLIYKYIGNYSYDLTLEMDFKQIGMDSIGYVSLMVDIEKYCGIEFEDKILALDYFASVRELIIYISNKLLIE